MAALLKFFIVILLVQGATAALMVGAVDPRLEPAWSFFAASALIIGVLAAIWFKTVTKRMKNEAIARTREEFIVEREQLLLKAEREKQRLVETGSRARQEVLEKSFREQQRLLEEGQRRVTRETNRVRTYASIKLWTAVAALAAVGSVLIFAQFITFGALALSGAGGTLIGYTLRARQSRLARGRAADGGGRPPRAPGLLKADTPDKPVAGGPAASE